MEKEKMKMDVPKSPSFFSRYRVVFVGFIGICALHVAWWQLVETYVPVKDRPKQFQFLGKLDSVIHMDKKKEEKT